MYKVTIHFHNSDVTYLAAIVSEEKIETLHSIVSNILRDRATTGNTTNLVPDEFSLGSIRFDSISAGPATISTSRLKETNHIFLELNGDSRYYL